MSEVRERPILFSVEMVRALRAKRKSRTRRTSGLKAINEAPDMWRLKDVHDPLDGRSVAEFRNRRSGEQKYIPCPYGQTGGRLWVRERFWQAVSYPGCTPSGEVAPMSMCRGKLVHYAADGPPENIPNATYPNGLDGVTEFAAPDPYASWEQRPSIFMPRWASRINLEITNLRVERLIEIDVEDCIAEGLSTTLREHEACCDLRRQYFELWDRVNLQGDLRSEDNPWVWVIEFRPGI